MVKIGLLPADISEGKLQITWMVEAAHSKSAAPSPVGTVRSRQLFQRIPNATVLAPGRCCGTHGELQHRWAPASATSSTSTARAGHRFQERVWASSPCPCRSALGNLRHVRKAMGASDSNGFWFPLFPLRVGAFLCAV